MTKPEDIVTITIDVPTLTTPTMLSRESIESWMRCQQEARDGWNEPNGALVPTEPDPEQRRLIRMRLDVQIATLMTVLYRPHEEIDKVNRRAEFG